MDGIVGLVGGITQEFERLLPSQRKTQRHALSLLVATMLDVRSANLMDLAAGLPRPVERIDMRFQWISRVLSNPLIDPDAVMAPFASAVMGRQAETGDPPGASPPRFARRGPKLPPPIVLIMDQSKISDRHQVLMLALRHGKRALPLLWRVEVTEGAIGFEVQKELLKAVLPLLPKGAPICLMADRFYGTADLIFFCQEAQWDYRIRLKGNLILRDKRGRATTGPRAADRDFALENVQLTAKEAKTNIGIIHDPGHAEPWIIAMPAKPGYLKTLEYSWRWPIEPMFSDFKSRGFGIEDTQIHYPDRVGRLILVMALALYFAVSTGEWDAETNPLPAEKNRPTGNRKSSNARKPHSSQEAYATSPA